MKTFYKHIDNGGIEVKASVDTFGNCAIEFHTSYFGYPSVFSSLTGFLSSEDIKNIGEYLIEFSREVSTNEIVEKYT